MRHQFSTNVGCSRQVCAAVSGLTFVGNNGFISNIYTAMVMARCIDACDRTSSKKSQGVLIVFRTAGLPT